MSGLLNENERVKVRGEKGLDELGMQLYSLDDVEEDMDDLPMKKFDSSSCIYTYTNSYVMHPDDGTSSITFSLPPSQMSSRMESRQTTCPSTPRSLSRRNSCSTFSVNVGLASMLNERGIKAVTPSCLNTPHGANYSPTVTPCNSPTGSSSPTREFADYETSLTSYLTSSAGILRRKFTGEDSERENKASTAQEKKAKIRLLQRVEHLGIDNILPSNSSSRLVSPLALHSSNIYTRYNSPMTQLTSLKHLSDKSKSTDGDSSSEGADSSISTRSNSKPETSNSKSEANTTRAKKLQRQKSRRNMNGSGQRSDLGTVNVSKSAEPKESEERSLVGGFVGSISSIFFGRKGGLL
jgi:trafficking kinesin-binding protein 1